MSICTTALCLGLSFSLSRNLRDLYGEASKSTMKCIKEHPAGLMANVCISSMMEWLYGMLCIHGRREIRTSPMSEWRKYCWFLRDGLSLFIQTARTWNSFVFPGNGDCSWRKVGVEKKLIPSFTLNELLSSLFQQQQQQTDCQLKWMNFMYTFTIPLRPACTSHISTRSDRLNPSC